MNLAAFDLADYTRDEAFAVQRELARRGFYTGRIDGDFGKDSRKALDDADRVDTGVAVAPPAPKFTQPAPPPASHELTDADRAPLDARSEANLATLDPRVQPLFRATLNRFNARPDVRAAGLVGEYTSGTRSAAEQQALYDKHDGTTNAPAWCSNHNYKIAADMTLFRGKTPVYESPLYRLYGETGEAAGLTWGGRWHMDDEPHLEFTPAWGHGMPENAVVHELHRRHDAGIDPLS